MTIQEATQVGPERNTLVWLQQQDSCGQEAAPAASYLSLQLYYTSLSLLEL